MDSLSSGDTPSSPDEIYHLEKVYVLVTGIPYFVLVWDWLSNLSKEYALFKYNGSNGGIFSLKYSFMVSRWALYFASLYVTLAWCTFVVAILASSTSHPNLCNWARYFPYGYSTTMLFAHFVMVLRMYSIYERSKKVLVLLLGLAAVDYALQMSANHAATSIYLTTQNPHLATCFLLPTSLLYSLVFISPTIFHHIILVLTLYKSIIHIRSTRAGGIKSIMNIVQRDHILFVLAICLINFANLVLVLQSRDWPYRLINQLPAAVFTQIFQSRIIFSLKHMQKKLASASVSPVITTLALSPSSQRREFIFGGFAKNRDGGGGGENGGRNGSHSNSERHGSGGSAGDLELGEGEEGKSRFEDYSPGESKSGHNKMTFSSTGRNVFALKFDLAKKAPKAGDAPSSKKESGGFQISTPNFESHALSSYRLPSPRMASGGDNSNISHYPPYSRPLSPKEDVASFPYHTQDVHLPQVSPGTNPVALPPQARVKEEGHDEIDEIGPLTKVVSSSSKQASEGPAETSVQGSAMAAPKAERLSVETPRTSFEPLKRRASTIDEQQRDLDWEPPSVWGSGQSPRASPIPFTERRLSNSIARTPLTATRSRHASVGTSKSGQISRNSVDASSPPISPASQQHQQSTDSARHSQSRDSNCYATVFSFEDDNEGGLDGEEDDEIRPISSRGSESRLSFNARRSMS